MWGYYTRGEKLIFWLFLSKISLQDGSTMLIEAVKGGHTNVVSYLLDYPNNVLSVPAADLSQLTPPSQDQSQVRHKEFFLNSTIDVGKK